MENQKSSSPADQVLIVRQDGGPTLRFEGQFKVHYDGHWVIVHKLNEERDVVIATLIYNRPLSVAWIEKDTAGVTGVI